MDSAETGKDTPQTDFLKGTLTNSGGKITITKQGDYTITATAKNYGGSTYTFSKTIHIYPTCDITVTADKSVHTDKAFTVKTTLSDNVTQQLNWHIFKDGKEVKWQDAVTGTLTNVGGSIQIKGQGSYTLKAVAHDETSREFFGKADVVVSPVVEISLQAPEAAHTDTMVAVMKTDYWSAAFTIVVDGIQVDFMELPEQSRIEILIALIAGKTAGELLNIVTPRLDRAAS